jgi:hypothetical protein
MLIFGIVCLSLIMIMLYVFSWKIMSNTKKKMLCIICADNDIQFQVQQCLKQSDVFYTNLPWSNSQELLTNPGTQPANETWILKSDRKRAELALAMDFKIEEVQFGLKVISKKAEIL